MTIDEAWAMRLSPANRAADRDRLLEQQSPAMRELVTAWDRRGPETPKSPAPPAEGRQGGR